MVLPSHAPQPAPLPGNASASACPAAEPAAPAMPSGGFTFSNSREVAPPLPLLLPVPPALPVPLLLLATPALPLLLAAAGSEAAGVTVVEVCFGLKGAPTGEPAPLVVAPSLRKQEGLTAPDPPRYCSQAIPEQLQKFVRFAVHAAIGCTASEIEPVIPHSAGMQLLGHRPLRESPRLDGSP